ncbi:hypothetical protein ACVWYN_003134 [Pedobacter sp. UYP24]
MNTSHHQRSMKDQRIYNSEFLNTKRLVADPQADEFIAYVFEDANRKSNLQKWLTDKTELKHLSSLKADFPGFDVINHSETLPPWAEKRLMKLGSAFFARHSEIIMSLLGLLSLPYCYTAANGAMVLQLSEQMRNQTTKRLYDTAIFVWKVMAPAAFEKNGKAYEEILKVRLIHGAVRYYTTKSGKWENAWGLPINQEDMAGTNLSFSLIVIRGLRLLGYTVSRSDQEAFMHTWAVIGHLTGLDQDLIPENTKEAQQLDIAIKKHQFCVSIHGKELTKSLTTHILKVNQSKATANEILGLMRYLLGSEIADMLSIEAPELPGYKISLLRTLNFLKGFKPSGNPIQDYRIAYAKFQKQSLELVQRN